MAEILELSDEEFKTMINVKGFNGKSGQHIRTGV